MASEFLSMVSKRYPELVDTLTERLEAMQAADVAFIRAAETELTELHQRRPRLDLGLRNGLSVEEFFHTSALPDPELIEDYMHLGLRTWSVVERVERRNNE